MNNEKATQILASWLVSSKGTEGQLGYIEGWFNKEDEEAFLMAIKALQGDMYCPSCGVRLVSENEYIEPKPYKGGDM